MTDKAWKAWERTVSRIFGGKRRGAYTGSGGKGKTDVIVDGWAIEAKLLSRPTYQQMMNACLQAETNAEKPLDIPVAIVKKKHAKINDALVIMRLEKFREWFVSK